MAYKYQELDRSDPEIRLLRLLPRSHLVQSMGDQEVDAVHCEIFKARLDSLPSYKALSYTWGNISEGAHEISLNGLSFHVQKNLWQALKHLRQENTDLILWADALCINQADLQERGHQVLLMGQIYRQATEVLAWLGNADDESEVAFRLVQEVDDHRDDEKWITTYFQRPAIFEEVESVMSLLTRSWFDRIWIVQEAVLGVVVTLICGNSHLDAIALDRFQALMASLKMPNGIFFSNGLPSPEDTITTLIWRGLRPIWATRNAFSKGTFRLSEAMQYHSTKVSSDPRDMVYGLLGLTTVQQASNITVDYECTVAEVYARFAKQDAEESQTLDFLTNIVWGVRCTFSKPSWVPDYSTSRRGHTRLRNVREPHFYYQASGLARAQVSFSPDLTSMTASGKVLCYIQEVGEPTEMEHRADMLQALKIFLQWAALIGRLNTTELVARDISFSRTLLANRFLSSEIEDLNRSVDEFLNLLLGTWVEWAVESHGPTALQASPVLKHWLDYKNRNVPTVDTNSTRILRLWVRDSCRYIWDRTIILNQEVNLIGLAPDTTRIGDVVCILYGCSLPMILRPLGDNFQIVGEAYVDGCMYGSGIERFSEQYSNTRKFKLV